MKEDSRCLFLRASAVVMVIFDDTPLNLILTMRTLKDAKENKKIQIPPLGNLLLPHPVVGWNSLMMTMEKRIIIHTFYPPTRYNFLLISSYFPYTVIVATL